MDWDDDDPWGEEPAWARDDYDDNDGNNLSRDGYGGAQHVFILIDCRSSMFAPCISLKNSSSNDKNDDSDGDSGGSGMTSSENKLITPFDAALIACEKLLRLRVHYVATSKSGKRDGVGIMLYGTKPHKEVIICNDEDNSSDSDGKQETTKKRKKKKAFARYKEGNYDNDEEEEDGDDSDNESQHNDIDDDDDGNDEGDGEEEDDDHDTTPISTFHTLLQLQPPGIKEIKTIRECLPPSSLTSPYSSSVSTKSHRGRSLKKNYANVDDNNEPSDAAKKLGQITLNPLRTALYEANKAFNDAKCVSKPTKNKPNDSKTLWIFTNEDNPCMGNNEEIQLVQRVAKDVIDNGLQIRLWPLPKKNNNEMATTEIKYLFKRDLFWNYITTKEEYVDDNDEEDDDDSDHNGDGSSTDNVLDNLEDMLHNVQNQWKKLRKVLTIPLLLPDYVLSNNDNFDDKEQQGNNSDSNIHIMLDFFTSIQMQKRPTTITISQLTKKPTVKTSHHIAADNGEIISGPRGGEEEREKAMNIDDDDGDGEYTNHKNAAASTRAAKDSNASTNTGKKQGQAEDEDDDIEMKVIAEREKLFHHQDQGRIVTFREFGGDRIPLSRKENALIKKKANAAKGVASLLLLGFKLVGKDSDDNDPIPLTHAIKGPTYFVYPNDELVRGSKVAFANLHASMVRKGVVGIGELLGRNNGASRLVSIYPQEEKRESVEEGDGNGRQIQPPGFIVRALPFEDDIRTVDMDCLGPMGTSEECVKAAMNLIKKQRLSSDVSIGTNFENPSLNKFWNFIEQVALQLPANEEDNDETKVPEEEILKAASKEIISFRNLLLEDDAVEEKTKKSEGNGGSRKRKATVEDDSGIDWFEMYRTNSLKDCGVATLKKYLRSKGLRLSGLKSELVLRISQHIQEEMQKSNADEQQEHIHSFKIEEDV